MRKISEEHQPNPLSHLHRFVKLSLAVLIAPASASVVLSLDGMTRALQFHRFAEFVSGTASLFVVFYLFALVTALVGGLPAYFVYRRAGFSSALSYALGGSALGAVSYVAWFALWGVWRPFSAAALLFVVAGLVAAVTFRAIIGDSIRRSVFKSNGAVSHG
jgi:hypothetical protein